ncbi:MAG: sulfatase-like hydrolase/transferase [Candidatus Marinimicrobia bacterium]|nr:sulfatase-like hydrolase/transferase [Candidatus Neomarinimicrobiota bacterium]
MSLYENIVMVIADSLRYDTVWGNNRQLLPFLNQHSMKFHQAYSAGCWTLPATASIFTGFLPHEHQATTRTRTELRKDRPTIAETLAKLGFNTIQITANTVTTHIFNLDRGFQRTEKAWQWFDTSKIPLLNFVLLMSKRRMRKRIMQGDFIGGKMSEDIKAGQAWFHSFCSMQLARAKEILTENTEKNKKTFLFINLMETHFPYHVSPKFKAISQSTNLKLREIFSLFHLVNQTWLSSGKRFIPPEMLQTIRRRQQLAWQRIAPIIDNFAEYLTLNFPQTLFIFLSDHGDNFGDENWWYHFSNVTEAGNRVPMFINAAGEFSGIDVHTPISTQQLYDYIIQSAELPIGKTAISKFLKLPPCLQSYWYNMKGKTLPQYQHDQFAFVHENQRFIHRDDQWFISDTTRHNSAAAKEEIIRGNPIQDLQYSTDQRKFLIDTYKGFSQFSQSI